MSHGNTLVLELSIASERRPAYSAMTQRVREAMTRGGPCLFSRQGRRYANRTMAKRPRAMRVWVSAWEQECCGDPIIVGGEVRWTLQEPDLDFARTILADALAQTITHFEEHHGSLAHDAPITVGTVTAIKAVSCKYGAGPVPFERTLYALTGTAVLSERTVVRGSVPVDDGFQLVAYLVDLEPA